MKTTKKITHLHNPEDGAAMSFLEIAKELGISEQAVHQRYTNAMRKMKLALRECPEYRRKLDGLRHECDRMAANRNTIFPRWHEKIEH